MSNYFWPRTAMQITSTVLLVQVVGEVLGYRKPGFEWVLPATGGLFAVTCLWALSAVVRNALTKARGER
jgi:hypothetical protein